MRLFVAVDIDEPTRAAAADVIDRLQRRLRTRDIKWVPEPNLHVTVQFIGHVSAEDAGRVRDALTSAIEGPAFDLRVAGLGAFPPRGGPRVIWCGVEDSTGQLARVQQEIARRLVPAVNLEPESRPFHPHLTIGRYREAGRSADRQVLETTNAFQSRFRVERVTLYESKLSPRGPTYHVVGYTPLTRAGIRGSGVGIRSRT